MVKWTLDVLIIAIIALIVLTTAVVGGCFLAGWWILNFMV
jgi:hypothetical protein